MKKYTRLVSTIALLSLTLSLVVVLPAQAQTTTFDSQTTFDFCHTFTKNIGEGSYLSSADASALQKVLTVEGLWVSTMPITIYNDQVALAITGFQQKYASKILTPNGLTHGTGYVGASTIAELNSLYGCTSASPVSSATCPSGALFNSITGAPCSWVATTVQGCFTGALFNSMTGAPCATAVISNPPVTITPTPQTPQLPRLPTINYFSPNMSNIKIGQNATLSWEANNASFCYISVNPSTGGSSQLGVSFPSFGTYTVSPAATTSYILSCYNGYNSKDGQTVSAKATVNFLSSNVASAPTCTLTSDKSSYTLGGTINFSWTSNAALAEWQQDTSGKDSLSLPSNKLAPNGTTSVTASVIGNPMVTLEVNNHLNTAMCSDTVNIVAPASTPFETATITQSTLLTLPNSAFTITGGTSAKSGSFTIVVVGPNYGGGTDWNTVGNLLKEGSYNAVANIVPLTGAGWSASFGGIPTEGYYTVLVYDGSHNLLTTGTLNVTYKG